MAGSVARTTKSVDLGGKGTAQAEYSKLVLLVPDNKTDDDYRYWSREIGKPSELGVQLQVAISYSDRSGPHVVATGTVGVPRPPEDDLERQLLANKLAGLVEAPDIAIFSFIGLLWWRLVEGGPFRVDLTGEHQVRQLDESEVSNSVSMSGPGPMNEPVFQTEFPESEDWAREYSDNRYLRFETRTALNQRYQDLIINITVLTHTGQVTLTEEKLWHRLFKHVAIEMFLRGEPPVPHNFHPSVAPAILFPDKELCNRAAAAVARVPKQGPYLVKYGKADHMRRLYEHGELHVAPASAFSDPDHNQAVHDHELSLLHYGVVANDAGFLKARDLDANADVMRARDHRFLPLFHAPKAQRDELTCYEFYGHDAWTYCMSDLLAPRLFSDFGADACVVLNSDAFQARICAALRPPSGNKVFAHGDVHYIDPIGAYSQPHRPPQVHICYVPQAEGREQRYQPFGPGGQLARAPEVHFSKTFRYAYQSEYRFVSFPAQPTDRLSAPLTLSVGPLTEIGQLIVL